MDPMARVNLVAERLVELYDLEFGGKERGRYRISMKHMRILTERRRIPAAMIRLIGEALFERGYILIDLETYFVILVDHTFRNYRRVSDAIITKINMPACHDDRD
jgi:hypothetical protein